MSDSAHPLEKHLELIHKAVRSLKPPPQEYGDLFQDACVAVLENWDKFDERLQSIEKWIYATALLGAIDALREGGAELIRTPQKAESRLVVIFGGAMKLTPTSENHDHKILCDEMLRTLPDKLAEVLRLRYFSGATYVEIGRKMGLDRTYVSRLHDLAIRILRESYS